MASEIERKFEVRDDSWRGAVTESLEIRQGYLAMTESLVLRVRIVDGKSAFLTVKAETGSMVTRDEFEYPVPLGDALQMMVLCGDRVIEKRRHMLTVGGKLWSIDVFAGRHAGLVIAEIELGSEDEAFERPGWLGTEVTGNPQFLNSNLATSAP